MQSIMCYSVRFMPAGLTGLLIFEAIPMSYAVDIALVGVSVGVIEVIGVCMIVITNVTINVVD